MTDGIAAYAARFGLVPIDDTDAARMVALFDRAAAVGAAIPRQTDKELEPLRSIRQRRS